MVTIIGPVTTPIRREEFLLAKAIAVLLPGIVVAYVVYGVFLAFVAVFLIEPTIEVVVGAFRDDQGHWTTGPVHALSESFMLLPLRDSVILSLSSAVLGALLGACLSAIIVAMPATSLLRRWIMSLCGVFAQFGGVTLAFAFIATLSIQGFLTLLLQHHLHVNIYGTGWLYTLRGLILVYLYFQIPLMVIVFTPALEGLRKEWGEAAATLGATRLQYFAQVVVPLMAPSFLGALLLLFANAFAAYATAAALITQGNIVLPLVIRNSISSEVALGHQHLAYAVALEMVVVVALVMSAYSLLLRRTSKWLS